MKAPTRINPPELAAHYWECGYENPHNCVRCRWAEQYASHLLTVAFEAHYEMPFPQWEDKP